MLIILLLLLACISCLVVCLPIISRKIAPFALSISIIIVSSILYYFVSDYKGQQQWQQQGAEHYQLQLQLQALGGYEGLEQRLQQYSDHHPNDKKAQEFLQKVHTLEGNASTKST
ncbi:MAG: hypothetical protein CMF50_04370 [Legionellales bacterium]|nr:hypothetical protein [Legionellales bacterium]|tara:strand:- start:10513 stop:10857 length:345 start_codon:yes stop_codon:yes gene_type:complete